MRYERFFVGLMLLPVIAAFGIVLLNLRSITGYAVAETVPVNGWNVAGIILFITGIGIVFSVAASRNGGVLSTADYSDQVQKAQYYFVQLGLEQREQVRTALLQAGFAEAAVEEAMEKTFLVPKRE